MWMVETFDWIKDSWTSAINVFYVVSASVIILVAVVNRMLVFNHIVWKFRTREIHRTREIKEFVKDDSATNVALDEKIKQEMAALVTGRNLNKSERERLMSWMADGIISFSSMRQLGKYLVVYGDRDPELNVGQADKIISGSGKLAVYFFGLYVLLWPMSAMVDPEGISFFGALWMSAYSLLAMFCVAYISGPVWHATYLKKKGVFGTSKRCDEVSFDSKKLTAVQRIGKIWPVLFGGNRES